MLEAQSPVLPHPRCHPGAGRGPSWGDAAMRASRRISGWVPAFAGMTPRLGRVWC